jgi:two-component system, OmpR family, KDP operon response regulator KdpE
MRKPLVLAVDDEPGILRLIRRELSDVYEVITAENGEAALEAVLNVAATHRPDLMILDLSMPEMDGLKVLQQLRAHSDIPVILLSGRNTDQDKLDGFTQGADDYLTKPFSGQELVARVGAVLRRVSYPVEQPEKVCRAGDIEIDLTRRFVLQSGRPVHLTSAEWRLLECLAEHSGSVVTNAHLLASVWGAEYKTELQLLRVVVSRLRAKLGWSPESEILKTISGHGYALLP